LMVELSRWRSVSGLVFITTKYPVGEVHLYLIL